MKKLANQSNKNSPDAYNAIFKERAKNDVNWADSRRWKELTRYFKKGVLIDLGCLDSQICELVKDRGAYYGIDLATDAIKQMNSRFGWHNAKFIVGDLYNTWLKNGLFNYAILGEVLEHLDEPTDAVKEAFRILEPGGVLAISVPLEEADEPGAVDKNRHLWSYTEKDIRELMAPYSDRIETKVLRSKWFPKYKYCWPQLITWAWKK